MKKHKYSICVFFVLFVICIVITVFSTADQKKQNQSESAGPQTVEEENAVQEAVDEEIVPSSRTEEGYQYIILESDGHLLVYYSDNMTVFFDSGILSKHLPEALQTELETGIRFADEESLYEFLENYSS
jgi:uncharacterized phage-like protein YoqJ